MAEQTTVLAVVGDGTLPVMTGKQLVDALRRYRELQHALDAEMPDQIMRLEGRPFRKKGYWRAIRLAFNLSVEPITPETAERCVVGKLEDGTDDYVYAVTYRATAPNGAAATGDGSCAAAEKARGRMIATEHNVRSHAHTRAFNRAISNLVGFGEVSAEEVERENEHTPDSSKAKPTYQADDPVTVTAVESKSGISKGKKWTSYTITLSDGRAGSTFKEYLAGDAEACKVSGAAVHAEFETKGKYTNLVSITAAEHAQDRMPTPRAAVVDARAPEPEPDTTPGTSDNGSQTGVYHITKVQKLFQRGSETVYGIETQELGKGQFIQTTDVQLANAALKAKLQAVPMDVTFRTHGDGDGTGRTLVALRAVRPATEVSEAFDSDARD